MYLGGISHRLNTFTYYRALYISSTEQGVRAIPFTGHRSSISAATEYFLNISAGFYQPDKRIYIKIVSARKPLNHLNLMSLNLRIDNTQNLRFQDDPFIVFKSFN